jgi:hypothetical protein
LQHPSAAAAKTHRGTKPETADVPFCSWDSFAAAYAITHLCWEATGLLQERDVSGSACVRDDHFAGIWISVLWLRMSAAARNSQDIGNLYSAAMVPAAIDQMVDAMEALDDDKLPAEDRIENAKENATKTLRI